MSYVRIAILLCFVIAGVAASAGQQTSTKRGQMLVLRNMSLYVMDDNGSDRRQIAEGVRTAAFSPDGDLVAFADSQAIKVLSLRAGGAMTLVRIQEGLVQRLVWAPSQRAVAYEVMLPGRPDALYVTNYPSMNEPPQKRGSNYRGMSFSPDGTFLVYADAVATAKKAVGVLYRLNLASGTREVLYETRTPIEEPKYSPDGTHIAFLVVDEEPDEGDDDAPNCAPPPNSLWVLAVGAKAAVKMKPTGPTTVGDFSWSPDGKLLAIDSGGTECEFPGTSGGVFVISLDQKEQFKLSQRVPSLGPRFSPDGKQVLFTDFDSDHAVLMLGNLVTRKLKPLAGQSPADDLAEYDEVVDWK